MTDHGVAVATPPIDNGEDRVDRSLAEQLVEEARADGVDLIGPGGLSKNSRSSWKRRPWLNEHARAWHWESARAA